MSNISKLPQTIKDFLFENVTTKNLNKFILTHDGETFETTVTFTADGSDVTIQTDDECWTADTETWLKGGRSGRKTIGPGIPMPGPNTVVNVYLVRHQ